MPISFRPAQTNGSSVRRRSRAVLALVLIGIALSTAIPLSAQEAATTTRAGRVAPLTLPDVLAGVRREHPVAQAASARIDAARASRATAGAFSNPVLQYQVENTPLPGGASVPMDREAMATAMIPLEPFYQRGPRIARANADVRAAQANASAQSIQLSLDASHAFYGVALAQVGVDVTRDLAEWLDSVVVYNRARVKEGIAAEADLLRAQLEQDRAAAELSMQEADLARARAVLASYFGVPPANAAIVVAIDDQPLALPLLTTADGLPRGVGPSAAISAGQPRVIAARERVASAAAGVSLERRMLVRDFSAVLGTKQTAGTTSLIAGVSAPLPLFTRNRGEIARASAEQRAVTFELAAVERAAWADLSGAYEAARVLSASAVVLAAPPAGARATTPALLLRADESRRIALGAYREGAVSLLSVLDAARAWGEVRLTFYRALYAQHESALALAAALGLDPQVVIGPVTTPAVRQ